MTREQYNRGVIRSMVACALITLLLFGCASLMPSEYQRPPECVGQDSLILDHLGEDPRGFELVEKLAVIEAVKHTSVTPDDVIWFLDWSLDSLDAVTYADFYMMLLNRVDWFNSQYNAEVMVLKPYFGSASMPTSKLINECDKALIRRNFSEIKMIMQAM